MINTTNPPICLYVHCYTTAPFFFIHRALRQAVIHPPLSSHPHEPVPVIEAPPLGGSRQGAGVRQGVKLLNIRQSEEGQEPNDDSSLGYDDQIKQTSTLTRPYTDVPREPHTCSLQSTCSHLMQHLVKHRYLLCLGTLLPGPPFAHHICYSDTFQFL
jgi:hypothetical protein